MSTFIILIFVFVFLLLFYLFIDNKKIYNHILIENFKKNLSRIDNLTKNIKYKLDYPIFYINLDKYKDRNNYMIEQLSKISDEFYRIKAVEGYNLKDYEYNPEKINNIGDLLFRNSYPKLSNSEIGCVLSHIKAIKTAFDMNKEYALICEDDVYFDILKIIGPLKNIVQKMPEDFEIIQLAIGGDSWEEDHSYLNFFRNFSDFLKNKFLNSDDPKNLINFDSDHLNNSIKIDDYDNYFGAMFYLINRKGMKKIIDQCIDNDNIFNIRPNKNNLPNRAEADFYLFNSCKTYTITPSLVIVNNTDLKSTIHNDHTINHIKYANKTLSFYLKNIEDSKSKKKII